MKIIKAKIIESNLLELEEGLEGNVGEVIEVVVSDQGNGWKDKVKQHFLSMYSEEDNIYDEI